MTNNSFDFLRSEDLDASQSRTFETVHYQLGNHLMAVNYSEVTNWAFKKTLRHIETDNHNQGKADLIIDCFVVNSNFKFPFVKEDYQDKGLLARFNDENHFSLFHHGVEAYSFYDRTTRRGYYLVKDPEIIPFWEFCAPFKYIIHWWSKDFDYQLVHGAFVDINGKGLLLSGKGGSGKSTTTVALVLNGNKTLGEDYLLVNTKLKIAYSLYNTAKLDANGLKRFPELMGHVNEKLLLTEERKTFFHIDEVSKDVLGKKQKIDYHILPKVSHSPFTDIKISTHSEGVKRLAPSTIFQLPRLHESTFKKCSLVCRDLPTYEVLLGSDLQELILSLEKIDKVNLTIV